jgi:hypothetical protein
MSSRTAGIAAGIILIAVALAWFLTPLSTIILDRLSYEPSPGRGPSPAFGFVGWDTLKLALDVANAVIGCVGIYVTLRSSRS